MEVASRARVGWPDGAGGMTGRRKGAEIVCTATASRCVATCTRAGRSVIGRSERCCRTRGRATRFILTFYVVVVVGEAGVVGEATMALKRKLRSVSSDVDSARHVVQK